MGGKSSDWAENKVNLEAGKGESAADLALFNINMSEEARTNLFAGVTSGTWLGQDPMQQWELDASKEWRVDDALAQAMSGDKGYGKDAQYWKQHGDTMKSIYNRLGFEEQGGWLKSTGDFLGRTANWMNDKQRAAEELRKSGDHEGADAIEAEIKALQDEMGSELSSALLSSVNEDKLAEFHGRSGAGQLTAKKFQRALELDDPDSAASQEFRDIMGEGAKNQLRGSVRTNQRAARDFGALGGQALAPGQAMAVQQSMVRQTAVEFANVEQEVGAQYLQWREAIATDAMSFAQGFTDNAAGIRDQHNVMQAEMLTATMNMQTEFMKQYSEMWNTKFNLDAQQKANKKKSIVNGIITAAIAVGAVVAAPATGGASIAGGASAIAALNKPAST